MISIFFVDCILGIFIGTNIINIIGYKKNNYIKKDRTRIDRNKKKVKELIELMKGGGYIATRILIITIIYVFYLIYFSSLNKKIKSELTKFIFLALTSFLTAICAWFGAFYVPFFFILFCFIFLARNLTGIIVIG